jgi:predicted O-methyltransferase YrrM
MVFEWQDVDFLYNFVKTYKPTSILELGSGHSTIAMGKAVYENGSGFVHALETKEYYLQTKEMLDRRFPVKVVPCETILENDWIYQPILDLMPKKFKLFGYYDLIYIDGPTLTEDCKQAKIQWDYRWLIIDGRKEQVESLWSDDNKPLTVFMK